MSSPQLVVLSSIGRVLTEADGRALAVHLGFDATSRLACCHPTIEKVLATHHTCPEVLVGTGILAFDAEAAAALGAPLVIALEKSIAVDGAHAELARHEAEEAGATVVAVFAGDDMSGIDRDGVVQCAEKLQPRMCKEVFEQWLVERARTTGAHIVLPEGDDDRILEAAHIVLAKDICRLTILGDPDTINARAAELGFDLSKATLVHPETDPRKEEFAAEFAELRKKKGVTLEQARETMKDISYYATMMIHQGLADGMVSGAAHTTAHTIKPSFQIIKTKPGASVVSSLFLMVLPGRLWGMGDCAVNPNPTADQLGEIAVVSAQTAEKFGIDPKVAIMSYSTGTSGSGPDVDRALAATTKARELAASLGQDIAIEGPIQFDAAVVPSVAAKKLPDSPVAGQANVFIFPDLEAGNIGYKMIQRTADALAVGPILQGLNKPVNDLSRGATVPDIVNTIAITAIQSRF